MFFLILCLKIIQHGTINSAYIYVYTFLRNDGLNYTLDSFHFGEKVIDLTTHFNLYQLKKEFPTIFVTMHITDTAPN